MERIDGAGSGGFRHAIAFEQRHADAVEEVRQVRCNGGAAGDGASRSTSEHVDDLAIHGLLVEVVAEALAQRQLLAGLLCAAPVAGGDGGTIEQASFEAGAGPLRGRVVHFLEHARHGED